MSGAIISGVVAIAIPLVVGGISGIATSSGVTSWYRSMRQSPWTPPNWVFAPVWTVLYALMGVASWLIWRAGWSEPGVVLSLVVYGIQLTLNFAWSFVFFRFRQPGWALLDMGLLWARVLATCLQCSDLNGVAGVLLVPYLLWVTYAATLNAGVWWLNR